MSYFQIGHLKDKELMVSKIYERLLKERLIAVNQLQI